MGSGMVVYLVEYGVVREITKSRTGETKPKVVATLNRLQFEDRARISYSAKYYFALGLRDTDGEGITITVPTFPEIQEHAESVRDGLTVVLGSIYCAVQHRIESALAKSQRVDKGVTSTLRECLALLPDKEACNTILVVD
jgi:hypothetical protein